MGEPEAAGAAPIPGRIVFADRLGIDEGLVLDDEGNLIRGKHAGRDQSLFDRIGQNVAGGHAGVDVQAGDAVGVIVVEHQPGALLVGVIIGRRAGTGIVGGPGRPRRNGIAAGVEPHIGDVLEADALDVEGRLPGRGNPLVRRAVADPGSQSAMEVDDRPVLGVHAPAGAPCPRP